MNGMSRDGRPRVVLVSATTFFGGGEVHYVKLARLLRENYEISAIVCNGRLEKELQEAGIRVWRAPLPGNVSRLVKLWAVCRLVVRVRRKDRPDIVHLNGGLEVFLAPVLKVLGTRTLITYHTVDISRGSGLKRIFLTLSLRCARSVICISRAVEQNLRRVFAVRHTAVVPNWLRDFPAPAVRTPPDGTHPLALLYVGRLEPEKGIFDLLEAIRRLVNVHLDVVGDGVSKEEAMEKSAGLPVTFHGFQREVESFYQRADLLVLPSWSEGQSLVLIEAMAAGLPCLISDLPAPLETAGDGRYVLTYRVGDVEDLVRAICSLQRDSARMSLMAGEASEYARQTYSEDRIRPMVFDIFSAALAGSGE